MHHCFVQLDHQTIIQTIVVLLLNTVQNLIDKAESDTFVDFIWSMFFSLHFLNLSLETPMFTKFRFPFNDRLLQIHSFRWSRSFRLHYPQHVWYYSIPHILHPHNIFKWNHITNNATKIYCLIYCTTSNMFLN